MTKCSLPLYFSHIAFSETIVPNPNVLMSTDIVKHIDTSGNQKIATSPIFSARTWDKHTYDKRTRIFEVHETMTTATKVETNPNTNNDDDHDNCDGESITADSSPQAYLPAADTDRLYVTDSVSRGTGAPSSALIIVHNRHQSVIIYRIRPEQSLVPCR